MEGDINSGPTSERVVGLAGAVLDDNALHELLQSLILLARHAVADCESVSITVAEEGRYRTSNSSGPAALAIDEAQYRDNGGPCLEAIRSKRQLEVAPEEFDGRWPGVQEAAREAGVAGVLSTPLVRSPQDDALGALNIYAREGGRFRPGDRRTAELIGEQAVILVSRALALASSNQRVEELRNAVATREIIGEAKGILMATQNCTRDEAFDILRRASQRENRKLREMAEDLVLRVEARAAENGPQA